MKYPVCCGVLWELEGMCLMLWTLHPKLCHLACLIHPSPRKFSIHLSYTPPLAPNQPKVKYFSCRSDVLKGIWEQFHSPFLWNYSYHNSLNAQILHWLSFPWHETWSLYLVMDLPCECLYFSERGIFSEGWNIDSDHWGMRLRHCQLISFFLFGCVREHSKMLEKYVTRPDFPLKPLDPTWNYLKGFSSRWFHQKYSHFTSLVWTRALKNPLN